MKIHIPTLDALPSAAEEFFGALGERRVVAFYGAMGAGKTTFIKALCEFLQRLGEPVFHFDFYRIRRQSEVIDLGFDDYLNSGCLCLMEWPELVEELLPDDVLRVTLRELPDGTRELSFDEA